MRSLALLAVLSLLPRAAPGQPDLAGARRLYEQAAEAAFRGELEDSIEHLGAAFDAGYPTPSDVLKTTGFRPLRHEPEIRRRLSALLRQHARESEVTIVTPEQLGERLRIDGRLVDGETGAPVGQGLIHIFHTTAEGVYAPESPQGGRLANNPYLAAWVRPDGEGRFTVHTVRPAPYAGFERPNMRHVHFEVEAPGYGAVHSQFYLDRDPEPSEERRRTAAERGWPILSAEPQADGSFVCRLEIRLRPRGP